MASRLRRAQDRQRGDDHQRHDAMQPGPVHVPIGAAEQGQVRMRCRRWRLSLAPRPWALTLGLSSPASPRGKRWHHGAVRHFDLCVIGSGSGNAEVDERFADQSVAIIEAGAFGGPVSTSAAFRQDVRLPGRSGPVADSGRAGGRPELVGSAGPTSGTASSAGSTVRCGRSSVPGGEAAHITVFSRRCHFTGPRRIQVGRGDHRRPDRGRRRQPAIIPEISGLDAVPYHTSKTVMAGRPAGPPGHLGGMSPPAEFAGVFGVRHRDQPGQPLDLAVGWRTTRSPPGSPSSSARWTSGPRRR